MNIPTFNANPLAIVPSSIGMVRDVETLVKIGYNKQESEEALRQCNNDVAAAAHYLFEVSL